MTEAGRGRRLVARAAIALLALAASTGARAACPGNATPNHIFAAAGDSCPVASGTYTPTVVSPFGNVVGLYAEDGGSISNAPSASVNIDVNPAGAAAILSNVGGSVTLNGGGSITLATTSTQSYGLFGWGDGSATGAPVTSISVTGVTIATNADDDTGAFSFGASVTLTDGSVTTNEIGSAGLVAFGGATSESGAAIPTTISATGTTITTKAGEDTGLGAFSYGVWIAGDGATGALTNDTIKTYGGGSDGVYALAGGVANLTGTTVTTEGDGAIGVYASGTSSASPATPSTVTVGGVWTIMTSGGVATTMVGDTEVLVPAAGVQADLGGQVTLSGGTAAVPNTVTTTGPGAIGVYASGTSTSSPITPSTVAVGGFWTIKTSGGVAAITLPDESVVYVPAAGVQRTSADR